MGELESLLAETLAVLDAVSESVWSTKIRRTLDDGADPAEVLSWFGGMGSFNDLLIGAFNGHHVRKEDEVSLNAKLSELRQQLYAAAKRLRI